MNKLTNIRRYLVCRARIREWSIAGIICTLLFGAAATAQETGTDPRDFAPKLMPYYRYTELENGLENSALTLFGLYAFTPKFAMTYEVPLGYKNDVIDTALNNGDGTCGPGGFAPSPGLPPIQIPGVSGNCQETGMGDMNLRFMLATDHKLFGGDIMYALQVDLPTATQNFLGTEQTRLGPSLIWVHDLPQWPGPGAFVAMMNFYFFDVETLSEKDAGDTSMYVGRWFVMLPLSAKYKIYALPEFQPIYDFENDHFSFWVGPEIGKMIGDDGKNVVYMKPGFGVDPDLVIHEAFMVPNDFVVMYNQAPQLAWRACCAFHTSGQAFGKIMSTISPAHVVAYHFFNEEATRYNLYGAIRETYNGRLSMAADNMVWNVKPDGISERMAVITDEAWSVPGPTRQAPPVKGARDVFSDPINSGY